MLNKNLFLAFFFILIVSSFVNAQPFSNPQTNININIGLQIEITQINFFKNSEYHLFNIHVFNISDQLRVNNTTTDCNFHLSDNKGNHLINQQPMTFDPVGLNFEYNVSGGNFTRNGEYNYMVTCNATVGGFRSVTFEVTPTGFELTTPRIILNVTLLFLLILFFLASLFLMFYIEHYIGKFALYWVSHLLLILITFIGWQYGIDGVLIGTAITEVFKILFLIITIAVFPMVILSIAWIVYIHAFNEHFQKLIDKGENPETAFSMAKKKHGGWFSGK